MRRTAISLAAWFAAGAAGVMLASLGVSLVTRNVTNDRPDPLDAEQVQQELAAAEDLAGPSTTTSTTAPPSPPPTSPGGSGTTPTTAPIGGDGGPAAGPAPSTTTVAGPTAATTTRTYDLVGGTLTLRFTPGAVDVVVATPKAGFTVKTGSSHGNGVQVEFRADDHRSRVDGWWDAGPRDEVREEAD